MLGTVTFLPILISRWRSKRFLKYFPYEMCVFAFFVNRISQNSTFRNFTLTFLMVISETSGFRRLKELGKSYLLLEIRGKGSFGQQREKVVYDSIEFSKMPYIENAIPCIQFTVWNLCKDADFDDIIEAAILRVVKGLSIPWALVDMLRAWS